MELSEQTKKLDNQSFLKEDKWKKCGKTESTDLDKSTYPSPLPPLNESNDRKKRAFQKNRSINSDKCL